jgi:hypothetical protein
MVVEVVHRVNLEREPTLEDRTKKIGLDDFVKKLQEGGWADSEGKALKRFGVKYEGHAELGNNYIEWRATLRD